jgi:hypothetical protein
MRHYHEEFLVVRSYCTSYDLWQARELEANYIRYSTCGIAAYVVGM